jgi:hypothetical protein
MSTQIVPNNYFIPIKNYINGEKRDNNMLYKDTIPGTGDYDDIVDYQNDLFVSNTLNNPNNERLRIFAMNYNILRIMSGLGGLSYAR